MKCVKNNLPQELNTVEIEIFSDLHIGSKKCNYKLIQERIKKVKDNKNTYCIIVGDIINNSTKTSVGDVYQEVYTPMQQIEHARALFAPIKDKILGVVSGNHERRSYKTDGVDLIHFLCTELGILDKYDYCSCLLFIRFGISPEHNGKGGGNIRPVCYTLYMTHGDGQGGRTKGGKINGLERRSRIINADIIVTGHTHDAFITPTKMFAVDYQNSSVNEKEQLLINASAALDYEEYAELGGMMPNSTRSPHITLNGKRKYATAGM